MTIEFTCDGEQVQVPDDGRTLLEVLRDVVGVRTLKDGCSPQGQCGCCTVLVDGQARVACVTPARRVRDREITTLAGLPDDERRAWADAFTECGASQCGFCTPGIIVRYAGLKAKEPNAPIDKVHRALAAHLCRCTGWQTIIDAWGHYSLHEGGQPVSERDFVLAAQRAELEGGVAQDVGPHVALGEGGFADDESPMNAKVAVLDGDGWSVADTLAAAREQAGKVQGRRTTADLDYPVEVPEGQWDVTLQTTWVEPAYLETDASWAAPGGEAASALGNGGAFGSKLDTPVGEVAVQLATEHDTPVRVLLSREDTVRIGPKRPLIAAGVNADGTGTLRVVDTPGIVDAIKAVAPSLDVEVVGIPGPPTSADVRGAGWVEALVLLAAARGEVGTMSSPTGGSASAAFADETIRVTVDAGQVLDEVVLRSYCIGAAHMAYSWVMSEGLVVDAEGEVHDLTVRSFGVVRSSDMPRVEVEIADSDAEPVNGSDAVFAAVAAAVWLAEGTPTRWPVNP